VRVSVQSSPGKVVQIRNALVLQGSTSVECIEIWSNKQQSNREGRHAGLKVRGQGNRLGAVHVERFDAAILLEDCVHARLQSVRIEQYLTGLHLDGCSFVEVASGSITGVSHTLLKDTDVKENVVGFNGLLIESCTDAIFSDLIVHDSVEHGIRIGGRSATRRCTFNNIQVRRAGWCGMKIQPRTKTDDPEADGSAAAIQINGLQVLDTAPHLGGLQVWSPIQEDTSRGRCGLRLENCSDVVVNGLQVGRDESRYYSASHGLYIARADDVTVNAPKISDSYFAGIVLSDHGDSGTAPVNQIYIRDPSVTFLAPEAHEGGVPEADGILITSGTHYLRNIAITGCYVRGHTGYGVKIAPPEGTTGVKWPVIVQGWVKEEGRGATWYKSPSDPDLRDEITTV
jgi:hypothetical protein